MIVRLPSVLLSLVTLLSVAFTAVAARADAGDATVDPFRVQICDINADAVTDHVIAAPGEAFLSNGVVQVYSGSSHALIATLTSGVGESLFGIAVSATADMDFDGRPDLAVAGVQMANGEPDQLIMHFYASSSWKELAFVKESFEEFANDTQVVIVGDADASGAVDLIDAVVIAQASAGAIGIEDINRDGSVDTTDVFEAVDRALAFDAAAYEAMGEQVAAQARASWWWCTKKGIWIGARIAAIIATVAGCEVNPPLCVVSLLCQACGLITDLMDFILQCFTDPIPEMLEAIDSVRWACDLCTIGSTIFNPGVLKEGIKRIWRQFAGMASATMAEEFSPCGVVPQ